MLYESTAGLQNWDLEVPQIPVEASQHHMHRVQERMSKPVLAAVAGYIASTQWSLKSSSYVRQSALYLSTLQDHSLIDGLCPWV